MFRLVEKTSTTVDVLKTFDTFEEIAEYFVNENLSYEYIQGDWDDVDNFYSVFHVIEDSEGNDVTPDDLKTISFPVYFHD
jgi:uncharacterized protein YnzC (UPF0291/DUF896 family)